MTTLVDNGNGSFTYTSEDGTVTTFNETTSTLVDNGNGTFTYTDEDETVSTVDCKSATVVDNLDSTYTITDDDTALIEFASSNIRCNAFWPIADTDMTQVVFERARQAAQSQGAEPPAVPNSCTR
mgnify:CR=1 FL=1